MTETYEEQLAQIVAWFQQLPDTQRLAAIGTAATVVLLDDPKYRQLIWIKYLAERLGVGVREWPGASTVQPDWSSLPN